MNIITTALVVNSFSRARIWDGKRARQEQHIAKLFAYQKGMLTKPSSYNKHGKHEMLDGNFFFDTRVFLCNYRLFFIFGWENILNFISPFFWRETCSPLGLYYYTNPGPKIFLQHTRKTGEIRWASLSQYAHKWTFRMTVAAAGMTQ
jgi:hypothetical protein